MLFISFYAVQVDSTAEFRLGQWVRIIINDASTGAAHACCFQAEGRPNSSPPALQGEQDVVRAPNPATVAQCDAAFLPAAPLQTHLLAVGPSSGAALKCRRAKL